MCRRRRVRAFPFGEPAKVAFAGLPLGFGVGTRALDACVVGCDLGLPSCRLCAPRTPPLVHFAWSRDVGSFVRF